MLRIAYLDDRTFQVVEGYAELRERFREIGSGCHDGEEAWARREMASIMTMEGLLQPLADQQDSIEALNKDLARKADWNAILTIIRLRR